MRDKSWSQYRQRARAVGWRPIALGAIIGFAAGSLAVCTKAAAAECPPGVPRCKILVLTPDMEQALVGPNMALDSAVWANRMTFENFAAFLKKAIADAPAGEVKKPEEPKK